MNNHDGISVVLPVFNEADIIENTISSICQYMAGFIEDVEIIAVNDGSKDRTLNILEQMRLKYPALKIISHSINQGYGSALRTGIQHARKPWILLMDSDGQFHIDALEKVWALRCKYEVILGYRQKRADAAYRLMLGKLGNTLSNLFLGRNIIDINCGFKLFKSEFLQSLDLSCTGGIINFETLYMLFKKFPSVSFTQISIEHYPRTKGASTGGQFRVIKRIVLEGLRIVLKK